MANESRTGGRSRTATTGFTEGNGAGIDSDQAGGELARLVELTDQGHDIDRARAILAREAGDRLSPTERERVYQAAIGQARAARPTCDRCDARDQFTGERCARLANHQGDHFGDSRAAAADAADAFTQAANVAGFYGGRPAIEETRANFGAALKGWARDAIAAYRSTRSAADLADIAHNADPRD